jgi:DNA ligase-1
VSDCPRFFDELATRRGPLDKKALLQERLARLDALAAKYLIKIITGDLRIGLKEGLVEQAIAEAFARPGESIREANMLSGDLGAAAVAAREGTLEKIALRRSSRSTSCWRAPSRRRKQSWSGWATRSGSRRSTTASAARCTSRASAWSCTRASCGASPGSSRTWPTACARSADFIADGELLAWQKGRALPFAELQKRLGRKGDDFFSARRFRFRSGFTICSGSTASRC